MTVGDRDIERSAVRILGGIGALLIVGMALTSLVRPDTPRDPDGAFTVLGAVIGAIGGFAAGRRR